MKPRIISLIVSFLFLLPFLAHSQGKDPVLLTVGGEGVRKSEFLSIYLKNNPKGEKIEQEALNEYLDLFIRFKLKVKEAEALGMDTAAAFRTELAGYRRDLAKPYLTDKATIDHLVMEAYERQKVDLRASHILLLLEKDAAPADTLRVWNKIMEIRKQFLDGADFGVLAATYSEDPSARDSKARGGQTTIPGNYGDLGYFTGLDMVYPFETGAYATELGKVSMPVRSDYGYHLIYVTDRKPAMGKATIAHIHVSMAPTPNAEDSARAINRISQIYQEILGGMSFEEAAAKFSDDKSSSTKGGVLPEFGVNRMVPEIIELIAVMDSGQVAPPLRTNYGWHIIKLIDRKAPGDFESQEAEIRSKVSRDGRSSIGRDQAALNVRKEYRFKEYTKNLDEMRGMIDSTITVGGWSIPEGVELDDKLLKIGKKLYTQRDLAEFIVSQQRRYRVTNLDGFLDMAFNNFVTEKSIEYLDGQLENRYPEFRLLVKEYRDGILLFNLMDEKVWSKAVKDTAGLRSYYEQHASEYIWNDRVEARVYTCANAVVAADMRSLIARGMTGKALSDSLNKANALNLKIESRTFEKGDNKIVDQVEWSPGFSDNQYVNGQVIVVEILNVIPSSPKTLKEARGLVTAAYQEQLETEWIAALRAKYPVVVNQKVLDTIK